MFLFKNITDNPQQDNEYIKPTYTWNEIFLVQYLYIYVLILGMSTKNCEWYNMENRAKILRNRTKLGIAPVIISESMTQMS